MRACFKCTHLLSMSACLGVSLFVYVFFFCGRMLFLCLYDVIMSFCNVLFLCVSCVSLL